MTDAHGGKDELSSTLASLRKESDLSTRQAAAVTGFSQAKVSRLERAINIPTEDDVNALLDAYQASPAIRRHLVGLARDIRAEHRPVVMARGGGRPGVFQSRLARIEAASVEVRAFSPAAVPGMLQIPEYASAVISARRDLTPERKAEFVQNRLRRQERLLTPEPPHFCIITTAAALGWCLGGPEVMAAQAEHIADVVLAEHARIGIIPWGAQADRVALHAWDIYDDRAVSYGTVDATAVLTEPRDVARYTELQEMVEGMAVFGAEASSVLRRIGDDYRRMA